MNGRVYDYNVGRFLSVDPVIVDPTNTQAINPYSYVMNNPLSYTDPSGYSPESNNGNPDFEEKIRVRVKTPGSRITRVETVTVTASGNADGSTRVSVSGGSNGARSTVAGAIAGKVSAAGGTISDIGSAPSLAAQALALPSGTERSSPAGFNGKETAQVVVPPVNPGAIGAGGALGAGGRPIHDGERPNPLVHGASGSGTRSTDRATERASRFAEEGDDGTNILYRALNDEDLISIRAGRGIVAGNINGGFTPEDHISESDPDIREPNSPWISTTESIGRAYYYEGGNGIAVIDKKRLNTPTARFNNIRGRAAGLAIYDREVLIYQQVPASAILEILPSARINDD
jgi:hypothetical protein